ncbi:MAG: sodium:proton antiporter NhaD [Gammaproteobacteria bacterium]|nr:sodium:proton antiporter NhaD [Gammaproteobacteria bacterium]
MSVVLGVLIFLGFLSIVVEDLVHINKAKTTLFFGSLVWILFYIHPPHELSPSAIQTALNENLLDIATLWLFLMAAMTFVAYVSSKGIIDAIIHKVMPHQISEKKLMLLVGLSAFVFSSFADNITATLICIGVLLGLPLAAEKRLRYIVLVVFAVNAGGVSLITGDVTTLMIFLAGKVAIVDLLLIVGPALLSVIGLAILLAWPLQGQVVFERKTITTSGRDWFISGLFLATIAATLMFNILFTIPPVLTFLFGLSLMFLVVQFLNKDELVLDYIRRIEFDTLLFFLGVLLLVGMLKELGVLMYFPKLYDLLPTLAANYLIGLLSALFDNVPLTAALLKSGVTMELFEWLSLTYAVGVGGSLLVIGSAAGVVAMSKVESLSFLRYLKFFVHLLVAYSLGFAAVLAMAWLVSSVNG